MATYVISYDLIKPGKNYENLIEAIKTYPSWCHALKSTWLVTSDSTARTIATYLAAHVDANDKLLVVEAVPGGAWTNSFDKPINDWLAARF